MPHNLGAHSSRMSSEPSGGWMQPSWRRLGGSTVGVFGVILAFLVGRVRAGTDPGLAREASQDGQQQSAPPLTAPSTGSGSGVDPQSGQGVDPGTGSSDDNFGNAIPDQGAGGRDHGGGAALRPPQPA